MSLDYQQSAGKSSDEMEGAGRGVKRRARPGEPSKSRFPHALGQRTFITCASNRISFPFNEWRAAQIAIKIRFRSISCRLANTKLLFCPCFAAFLPKWQQVFWAAPAVFPCGSETQSATQYWCEVINYFCSTSQLSLCRYLIPFNFWALPACGAVSRLASLPFCFQLSVSEKRKMSFPIPNSKFY